MAPQTTFETAGGWTSLEDETALLDQVAAETSATVSEVGQSVEGLPIRRVDIGDGTEQTLLIVSGIHGNEQASREAALMQIRDLAYAEDSETLGYLAEHRVVFVPTASPDTFPDGRFNKNGVNPNRDFFALTQPETRAVVRVISDSRPHMIVDAHEYFSEGEDWWGRAGGLPSAHPEIAALENSAYENGLDVMRGNGYTARDYALWSIPTGGLSTTASAHHAVGLLSETNALHGDPQTRVDVQKIIFDMVIDWHRGNAAECTAASEASREYAMTTTDEFMLPDNEYIGRSVIVPVDARGYRLGEELPQLYADAFGVEVHEGGFVPMRQEARSFVPHLLDPRSVDVQVVAERVPWEQPEIPEALPVRARVGGATRDVVGMVAQTGGQRRTIDTIKPGEGTLEA